MLLCVLLLLLGVQASDGWNIKQAAMRQFLGYEENCAYTREQAIACFSEYVDTNHDGKISLDEIYAAENKYMGWALKMLRWVVSWAIDIDPKSILRDCGPNEHNEFTADSFRRTAKTCIASQEALCMVKAVCERVKRDEEPAVFRNVKEPRVVPVKKGWWW